jgi:hypothetical protein
VASWRLLAWRERRQPSRTFSGSKLLILGCADRHAHYGATSDNLLLESRPGGCHDGDIRAVSARFDDASRIAQGRAYVGVASASRIWAHADLEC